MKTDIKFSGCAVLSNPGDMEDGSYQKIYFSQLRGEINLPDIDENFVDKETVKKMSEELSEIIVNQIKDSLKQKKEIDWEQRRYEIAKDVIGMVYYGSINKVSVAENAVSIADQLIEELKKKSNE